MQQARGHLNLLRQSLNELYRITYIVFVYSELKG